MIDYPPGNLVAESVRATRFLESDHEPVVLAFYPWARMNPYQALIYTGMWEAGIAPIPVLDLLELDDLPVAPAKAVFHLHWTTEIIRNATDEALARERVDAFTKQLDAFLGRGGKFMWTVHNVMPHTCPFPDVERELRQQLAERADLIHVHCAGTREAASSHFDLPAHKVVMVPHPSYDTYYDSVASQRQARFELDLNPAHTVIGMFGAMKGYKGLDRLQRAFAEVTSRESGRNLRLIVAGMLDPKDPVDSFVDWAYGDSLVTADFRKVPLADLQMYLAATDVVVLPYRRTLNSGVALMALSQGIPLIGPETGCVGDLITPEVGITFDTDSDEAFVKALERTSELRSAAVSAAAIARAEEFSPAAVSRSLAEAIHQTIGG